MMRLVITAIAALAIGWASPAGAQDKAAPDNLYIDFVVPDLPALAGSGSIPGRFSARGPLRS